MHLNTKRLFITFNKTDYIQPKLTKKKIIYFFLGFMVFLLTYQV